MHYVARIVVEKVTPAEPELVSRHNSLPPRERKVEEMFSAVVKSDATETGLERLQAKIVAVIGAGL